MTDTRVDLMTELRRCEALRLGKIAGDQQAALDHRILELRTAIAEMDAADHREPTAARTKHLGAD